MTPRTPPRWARWLARLLVRGAQREFVLGDLDEMYARDGAADASSVARYLARAVRSGLHEVRDATFSGLRADVRVALRQLRRNPRVHLGGAAVLAVGVGIATLTWGVRYGTFGRPLPVTDPGRVLSLRVVDERTRAPSDLSLADVEAVRERVTSVEAIGIWTSGSANLTDGVGPPMEVETMETSAGLLDVFEITPLHGRSLVASDEVPGAPRVALLGYRYWQARHGGDPGVVGSSIRLDGVETLVVGVLPEGKGLTAHEEIWRPAGAYTAPGAREFNVQVRVRPGASRERLASELTGLADRLEESGREEWVGRDLSAVEFNEGFYGGVENVRDRVLLSGGLLLYVMALANVANLFLVSTRVRARELAVRRALGGGRLRIFRQLLVEASIPAVLGFTGATAVAAWALACCPRARHAYGIGFVWQAFRVEAPHLLLIATGCLASTVFVSLTAALRELGSDGGELLNAGRGHVQGAFRLGRVLLGVEVAVGAALLLVASLMVRSGWNLRSVDHGFTTETVMTGDVTLRGAAYSDRAGRLAFWQALQTELESLDGVLEAAVGTQLPMIRCCGNRARFEMEGRAFQDVAELPVHYVNAVGPTYFDTFEKPILSGRGVTSADSQDSDPVVVVNVHFASLHYPGETPIGRRLRLWRGGEPGPWLTIVGVAPHLWMDTDVNANPEGVYVPLAQDAPSRASFAIRVSDEPERYADGLRAAVLRLDPELPVNDLRSMPQLIRDRTSLYRREGPLFTILGGAALVLAVAGLYAVVSYMASLRLAELGLRRALGATRAGLVLPSVGGAVLPTLLGSAAGLTVGLGLTRGFDRFVFMVDPWSPGVVAATVVVLMTSATAASLMPALRASRVDPADVLRSE